MWLPIKRAGILNFRAIRKLRLDLHPEINVLFGTNAAGKTTVLDALAIGLGAYHARLPNTAGRNFARSGDLRLPWRDNYPHGEVEGVETKFAVVHLSSSDGVQWARPLWRSRQDESRTLQLQQLPQLFEDTTENALPRPFTKELHARIDERVLAYLDTGTAEERPVMPFAAAYGTQRAMVEVPLRERGFSKEFKRFAGLDGSLDTSARFKTVFEWFRLMEDEERRQQQLRRDFDFRLSDLEWVRRAIANAGLRCRNPRVELRPIRMMVDFQQYDESWQTLDITHLSDGYRTHFSLVVDIARRMVQLNPSDNLAHPERGTNTVGTVLIDEIDLHLHPVWQGTVLQGLRNAFPNTQFIVTTHSEQVIASVPRECVQKLVWRDDAVEVEPVTVAQGATSDRILTELMDVPLRVSGPATDDFERAADLVSRETSEDSPELATLLNRLESKYGMTEEVESLRFELLRRRLLADDDETET